MTTLAYFVAAMLRQLLTLLALITGLAATAAPAEARVPGLNGASVELAAQGVAAVRTQSMIRIAPPAARVIEDKAGPATGLLAALPQKPASVLVGIDRARE